jgi:hypothetical protein
LRTDPVGVQAHQERRLAEAERQARQLDASPAARSGWGSGFLLQLGLAVFGIGILFAAYLIRRRA